MKPKTAKLKSQPNPWKQQSNKQVYENPWFCLEEDDVINPGGGLSHYGKILFKNLAIGIIPLDDQDNTWLVGQYRYLCISERTATFPRAFAKHCSWRIGRMGGFCPSR